MQLADVAGDKPVALGIAERLAQHAMGVADGAGRQPAGAQRRVPSFDVEARQPLQQLDAEVRGDLVFDQLAIAQRRPRRDVTGGLPYFDSTTHEFGDRRLARLDKAPLPHSRNQYREPVLRFALGAAKCLVLNFALARGIASGIEFQPPRTIAALGDVSTHLAAPISRFR